MNSRQNTQVCHTQAFCRPLLSAVLLRKLTILSQAGRVRYIVICINPAFTKMIDGTEIPWKFAKKRNAMQRISCKADQYSKKALIHNILQTAAK